MLSHTKPQSKHASAAEQSWAISLVRALWHATQFEFTDDGAAGGSQVSPNAAIPRVHLETGAFKKSVNYSRRMLL